MHLLYADIPLMHKATDHLKKCQSINTVFKICIMIMKTTDSNAHVHLEWIEHTKYPLWLHILTKINFPCLEYRALFN